VNEGDALAVQRLSEGQSITFIHEEVQSQAAIQPAIKVAAGATGMAGCLSIGVTIAVVLLVAVIVLAALASSGGPLFETWSKINPISFARLESSFGEEGSGAGYLTDPRSIAVEAEGNIYVGEYQGGRIQKFDATGKFLSLIPGEKDRILQNLATDRDGLLYAAYDGDINRIDSSTGEALGIVAHPFEYAYFEDVVATPEGGLLSIVDSEDVVRFNPSGEPSLFITDSVSTITQDSELEARVAVDGMGNIYVLGGFNSLVMKYSPEGRYLTSFGGSGDGPGQFNFPYAIAVDAYGRVFVSDGTEIHVFDSDGRFLEQFSVPGAAFGMTFDDQNKLYIVTNAPKVYRYAVSEP